MKRALPGQPGKQRLAVRRARAARVCIGHVGLVDELDGFDRQNTHPCAQRPARLHRRTPPTPEGKRHAALTDAAQNVLPEEHPPADPTTTRSSRDASSRSWRR